MNESVNILIVDDNPENLRVVSYILKDQGYKLALAQDGIAALKVLNEITIDLILLDIILPGMDGYEVCNLIKEDSKFSEIPIIFISALNYTNDIVRALQAGGVDYITKPFQTEEVKARVATHIKISQQKKELVKLNEDKDRFISILAHDLRNPFNTLLGYAELLVKKIRIYTLEEIEQRVQVINNILIVTENLLADILLWAKVQSGKLPFEPLELHLLNLCSEITESLKLIADAKGISIKLILTDDFMVYADLNMLLTVFRNLISNAIKFTNKGGFIKIYAEQNKTESTITVSDNGLGMDQATMNSLFDISQIQTRSGTEDEKGTGFGLLLCSEFVEKHGGKIWVESELGKGSNFKFTLPYPQA